MNRMSAMTVVATDQVGARPVFCTKSATAVTTAIYPQTPSSRYSALPCRMRCCWRMNSAPPARSATIIRTRLCQSSTSALTLARDWLVEFKRNGVWGKYLLLDERRKWLVTPVGHDDLLGRRASREGRAEKPVTDSE